MDSHFDNPLSKKEFPDYIGRNPGFLAICGEKVAPTGIYPNPAGKSWIEAGKIRYQPFPLSQPLLAELSPFRGFLSCNTLSGFYFMILCFRFDFGCLSTLPYQPAFFARSYFSSKRQVAHANELIYANDFENARAYLGLFLRPLP